VSENLQELAHGEGHDYEPGSPHLEHPHLRNAVLGRIRDIVGEQLERRGHCRVLEIGAGHGAFTDHVLAMGADVVVTEMSRPSLIVLERRYRANPKVTTVFDPDGEAAFGQGMVDVVLCVSVLHHIPDYASFVGRIVTQIEPGGAFASFQDPTYYPRRTAASVKADRLMYLAWRVRQGALRQGIATQLRRFRGVYDESLPSDMSEYHVVRQGVDEQELLDILRPQFRDVELWEYFSTQGRAMQKLGDHLRAPQTFALIARDRRD
jgi:SAM-dependent methyltransferase